MKRIVLIVGIALAALQLTAQDKIVDQQDIDRILSTLASDEMRGRASLSPDIIKAADFIADEFRNIGLQPYAEENYRQTFHLMKTSIGKQEIRIDGNLIPDEDFLVYGYAEKLRWDNNNSPKINHIPGDADFSQAFRSITRNAEGDELIWVHRSHAPYLARFKKIIGTESIHAENTTAPTKVFVLVDETPTADFQITASTLSEEVPLFNVIGMLPGKSKVDEYVIFSAHYDHIGILDPVEQDSIANGADDDASGITAMIALAQYFKKLDQHERTLLFVAFTAEEIGLIGSKYFSSKIKADQVVAMINIEMIGKDAKFGPNSMYITGFDASDLGKLMQEKVKGTEFTFHPDPYPQQNLFYRSDNASLAALGVPAHTFSTVQIDKDEYYHTVKDEVATLDIENIKSSIEAIAKGVIGIVNGTQTPSRVEKLR